MKHLCIDARMAFCSGIGVYIREIVPYFREHFSVTLLVDKKGRSWCDGFTQILFDAKIYSLKEQFLYPQVIPKCDLFFSPHYNVPISPIKARKRIVTIHDTCHLVYGSFFAKIYARCLVKRALFRFFLLVCQFFFVVGASAYIQTREQAHQILHTYLRFHLISLFFGLFCIMGFYTRVVPYFLIERFSVLTQFGWGFLRLSPGSYPNEYGIVSSFVLSVLTIIFFENRTKEFGWSKRLFYFLYMATFLGLLLTTTRAAFLSFFCSLVYIGYKEKRLIEIFAKFSAFALVVFGLLLNFRFNMLKVLHLGFSQKLSEGSLYERVSTWQDALSRAQDNSFWGVGFASLTNVHNVYIQLFFELGIMGGSLLILTFLFTMLDSYFGAAKPKEDSASLFYQKVRMVGLISVLSFAASNHNLNHHLTWLTVFFCLLHMRFSDLKEKKMALSHDLL